MSLSMLSPLLFKLHRPSLMRRLTLTLVTAFALIWVVQFGLIFAQSTDQGRQDLSLKSRADALLRGLAAVNDPAQALAVMVAVDELLNRTSSYAAAQSPSQDVTPSRVGIALTDSQGLPIYRSPDFAVKAHPGGLGTWWDETHGLRQWRVHEAGGPRWRLWVGETVVDRGWLIGAINARMAPYVVLSFLLVLLPMWWALALGLRPLQRLSELIFRRQPSDLRPLGFKAPQSELKPLVAELERLLADLRRKVEREHAFVHDAAHELRTPLAAVSLHGFGVLRADSSVARQAAADGLQAAISRSSRVIEQLLQLASLEHGDDAGEAQLLDLSEVLRSAVAMQAPGAMQRGLDVRLIAPDRLEARVNASAFTTIVHNLLANAILYVPASVDAPGHVQIELRIEGRQLVLDVADDGLGVAADQRAGLFERFRRGDAQQAVAATGSGLGLAIVRQAAMRLGGDAVMSDGLRRLDAVGLRVTVRFAWIVH